ncbi:MAG TPA: pilus assembly protein TadG-related protein [Solirubrobacteraceae bacterium]|jgi:Flp pilus assembly protein TadG|nr:pilus assembly protein TadG-related protein [Solirubrobacteraceae bacterium]
MAAACPHTTPARRVTARPDRWLRHRLEQSGSQSGQALIITALAMTLVLVISAFAIDLATWYQKHHQAQVAADSAALAAANCLANGKTNTSAGNISCSSATDAADAQSIGTQIATTNLPGSNDQVTVNTTSHTVTVTSSSSPQVDFAGLMSLHPTVNARSVASYATATADYSVFVGNDTCPNVSSYGGIGGLQIQSNGGGNATVTGLYSDGIIQNNDDSGSANYSGGISDGQTTGGYDATATPLCGNGTVNSSNTNYWETKNTTVEPGEETAYPEQYSLPAVNSTTITTTEPTSAPTVTPGVCTFGSTYFSTSVTSGIHAMNWPGIYCITNSSGSIVTSLPTGDACNASSYNQSTDSIWVETELEGAYEFVGPCVMGYAQNTHDTGISSSIQAIVNPSATPQVQPIVYGTLMTGSGPCLAPTTTFVNPGSIAYSDSVWLSGENITLNGPIYAPCGTAELTGNNAFNTFLEAANVTIDKNNFQSWAGTGPPSVPASDGLTS